MKPLCSLWLLALSALTQLAFLLSAPAAHAGSATWQLTPVSGDWNTAANWMPNTVPNGPTDTATFAFSHTRNVFVSAETEVASLTFGTEASSYLITVNGTILLTLSGTGVANNLQ